ncbi:ATP-binding protein [Streptomyces sp. MH13]|uniref:ATP-binding protein n=1 Tax=Streptomyces sp. MH13 TaxID=3417651 RepID=UPI003CEA3CA7
MPCATTAHVQLCASELVTNVIQHLGEGIPVTVRVWCDGGGPTRLEVTDPDPCALPVLRAAVGVEEESGRGLALLDALTVRWGVTQGPSHKTVWCEVREGPSDGGVVPGRGAVSVASVSTGRRPEPESVAGTTTAGRGPR